jgi:hypothetical protein
MSQRFRMLEQIAFSLVVMFGLVCFAVVTYAISRRRATRGPTGYTVPDPNTSVWTCFGATPASISARLCAAMNGTGPRT